MTLNEECVRDVLIYCKNNIDYRELQDGSFSLIPVTFKQLLASPLNQTVFVFSLLVRGYPNEDKFLLYLILLYYILDI